MVIQHCMESLESSVFLIKKIGHVGVVSHVAQQSCQKLVYSFGRIGVSFTISGLNGIVGGPHD